jgi:dephospho-CoA kinase
MLHVGLTGNIASGKSAVAERLAARGATVIDADALARAVLAPDTAALARVRARFGMSVFASDGSLDRAALGRLIFSDPSARRDLEAIVHPEVARGRAAALAAARKAGARVVVSDVPLLFEAGLEGEFDRIVVVDAPEPVRLARLMRDRGLNEADARSVMAAQADPVAKRARATHLIENAGSLDDLDRQVAALWDALQRDIPA